MTLCSTVENGSTRPDFLAPERTFQCRHPPLTRSPGVGLLRRDRQSTVNCVAVQAAERSRGLALQALRLTCPCKAWSRLMTRRYRRCCLYRLAAAASAKLITAQSLGGTGALKTGRKYSFIACWTKAPVAISDPSWETNRALSRQSGLKWCTTLLQPTTHGVDREGMLQGIEACP